MSFRDAEHNGYLIQTIHRCNYLLRYRTPSRRRIDLITIRLRTAMGMESCKGLTLDQVDLLLAKAYSVATLRKAAPARRELAWPSRVETPSGAGEGRGKPAGERNEASGQ